MGRDWSMPMPTGPITRPPQPLTYFHSPLRMQQRAAAGASLHELGFPNEQTWGAVRESAVSGRCLTDDGGCAEELV
jgi:hypothetical protein